MGDGKRKESEEHRRELERLKRILEGEPEELSQEELDEAMREASREPAWGRRRSESDDEDSAED